MVVILCEFVVFKVLFIFGVFNIVGGVGLDVWFVFWVLFFVLFCKLLLLIIGLFVFLLVGGFGVKLGVFFIWGFFILGFFGVFLIFFLIFWRNLVLLVFFLFFWVEFMWVGFFGISGVGVVVVVMIKLVVMEFFCEFSLLIFIEGIVLLELNKFFFLRVLFIEFIRVFVIFLCIGLILLIFWILLVNKFIGLFERNGWESNGVMKVLILKVKCMVWMYGGFFLF